MAWRRGHCGFDYCDCTQFFGADEEVEQFVQHLVRAQRHKLLQSWRNPLILTLCCITAFAIGYSF